MQITASIQLPTISRDPREEIPRFLNLARSVVDLQSAPTVKLIILALRNPGALATLAATLPADAPGFRHSHPKLQNVTAGRFLAILASDEPIRDQVDEIEALLAKSASKLTIDIQLWKRMGWSYHGCLTDHMSGEAALDLLASLLHAAPSAIRSTCFFSISLEALSLHGAPEGAVGILSLKDLKWGNRRGRKLRFYQQAQLTFAGANAEERQMQVALRAITEKTGLPFTQSQIAGRYAHDGE